MPNLSSEQLAELTARFNARLLEFGEKMFDEQTPGVVRLFYDEVERWQIEQDEEVVEDYANARAAAYERGYEAGLAARAGDGAADNHRWFESTTPDGKTFRIKGDPSMSPETERALGAMSAGVTETDDDPTELADAWPNLPDLHKWNRSGEHPVMSENAPPKSDEKLTKPPQMISRMPVVDTGMVHEPATAPTLSPQAAATLGPEHTTVTPLQAGPGATRATRGALAEVDAEEIKSARVSSDERAAHLRDFLVEIQAMSTDGRMPSITEWEARKPTGALTAQGIMGRHGLTWSQLADYAKLKANRQKGAA